MHMCLYQDAMKNTYMYHKHLLSMAVIFFMMNTNNLFINTQTHVYMHVYELILHKMFSLCDLWKFDIGIGRIYMYIVYYMVYLF